MALFKASAVACLAATAAAWECTDYSKENEGSLAADELSCWENIEWAIDTGLDTKPEWYPEGTTKTETDAQCALFLKYGLGVTHDAHHCTLPPCAAISDSMMDGGGDVTDCIRPVESAVSTTTEAPGPSIKWWGWVLIVPGICALGALCICGLGACIWVVLGPLGIGLGALFLWMEAPKKKRAVKTIEAPEPEPAPVVTSVTAVPTYEVAPPIYTYSAAAPVYEATQSIAVAAPQVITAPPVMTAPPVYAAAPTMTAAPVYTTGTIAAPQVVSTIAAPQVVSTIAAPYTAPYTGPVIQG